MKNFIIRGLLSCAGALAAERFAPGTGLLMGGLLFMGQIDIVEGSRATNDISTMRLKIDMDTVSLLNPNKAPFVALMTRLNKQVTINPKYWHIERRLAPRWDNVADGVLADDGEITVENASYFTPGDVIVVIRTGERMLVTDVDLTADQIEVSRSIGATDAAPVNDGDEIQIIGNAKEEGSEKRDARATVGVDVFNFTQIFESVFGVSNTADATGMHGGKDINTQRKEWGITHAIDLERASWFGERGIMTGTNGKPLRLTGGLLDRIYTGTSPSRIVTLADTLTEPEFDAWLDEAIEHDPEEPRVIFISRLIARQISSWAKNHLELVPSDTTYGIRVMKYRSAAGDFNLIVQPLFRGELLSGMAVAVPLKECKYRPLQGRDTHLLTNVQLPGADEKQDMYRTEAGFQFKHPEKFALLRVVPTTIT